MRDHHDPIGAQPIGKNGDQDRNSDERYPSPQRAIIEIGEQDTYRERRHQVTHAAATADDRPGSTGDHEEISFAIHRDIARAQRIDHEIRRHIDQMGCQAVAQRHRQKQESERKSGAFEPFPAGYQQRDTEDQRNHHQLLNDLHVGQVGQHP